jgi:hypothetical protein
MFGLSAYTSSNRIEPSHTWAASGYVTISPFCGHERFQLDAWSFGLYYVVDDKVNQRVRNEFDAIMNEWLLAIWLYVLHLVQYFLHMCIKKLLI